MNDSNQHFYMDACGTTYDRITANIRDSIKIPNISQKEMVYKNQNYWTSYVQDLQAVNFPRW